MLTVRRASSLGLTAGAALLATLARTVGLSAAGWLVGLACVLTANLALAGGLAGAGATALGPANRVTLVRAMLVGAVAALVADGYLRPEPVPALIGLATVALVLDAVDGWVARRTGTVTPLGARFDMEVDAFLILVLSCYVARSAGPWVLAIGAARYALGAAGRVLPWLRAPVPPRYWRKTVAAIQGVVLTVAAADLLPRWVAGAALVVALALLTESFGRDVWWLHRTHRAVERSGAGPRRLAGTARGPLRPEFGQSACR